jgi:hypothetical protein
MSQVEVQDFPEGAQVGRDERTEDEKKTDEKLAERLSALIEDANSRVGPLCKMIRKVRWVLKQMFPKLTRMIGL